MRPAGTAAPVTAAVAAALVAVAGFGLVTGCATSSSNSQPTSSGSATTTRSASRDAVSHNDQDIAFSKQLILINEQLSTISNILTAKVDAEAGQQALAEISRAANEQIAAARSLSKLWETTAEQATPTPTLLTERQLEALLVSTGTELGAMTEAVANNYEQTVNQIAASELASGDSPAAKKLAEQVRDKSASLSSRLIAAARAI